MPSDHLPNYSLTKSTCASERSQRLRTVAMLRSENFDHVIPLSFTTMTETTETKQTTGIQDVDNTVDTSVNLPQQGPKIHVYGLALVFMAPALGGFLYGYDIGATSFVLAMIRESRDHDVWWYNMPSWQQGLLVSALALGGLIGSHIVLVYLSNSIGRRKEIRIAATLYIVGSMMNAMSVSTGRLLFYEKFPLHHGSFLIVLLVLQFFFFP